MGTDISRDDTREFAPVNTKYFGSEGGSAFKNYVEIGKEIYYTKIIRTKSRPPKEVVDIPEKGGPMKRYIVQNAGSIPGNPAELKFIDMNDFEIIE